MRPLPVRSLDSKRRRGTHSFLKERSYEIIRSVLFTGRGRVRSVGDYQRVRFAPANDAAVRELRATVATVFHPYAAAAAGRSHAANATGCSVAYAGELHVATDRQHGLYSRLAGHLL